MGLLSRGGSLLLLGLGLASAATGDALPATTGDRGLALVRNDVGSFVVAPAGDRVPLQLAPGERITELAELEGGWVAAGVGPVGIRDDLIFLTSEGARLPPPGGALPTLRLRPTLLVGEGRLAGVAWLEGDSRRRLGVVVAARTRSDWSPPVVVSPPGPGSQTGLAACRLEDGDWLLVWSAFDGSDDELFWSRGLESDWTVPRRLGRDNGRPDVTPALAAITGGALVVWSRLGDAGYGLWAAAFDGLRWSPEEAWDGDGLAPRSTRLGPRIAITTRTTRPSGWSVLELAADGRRLGRLEAPTTVPDRPRVTRSPTGQLELWHETEAEARRLVAEPAR